MSERTILVNAQIVDGSGNPSFRGNVVINGDTIEDVIRTTDKTLEYDGTVIDVGGKYLSPGFIDVHNHDDLAVIGEPDLKHRSGQGVTTSIAGNCGLSLAPLSLDPLKRDYWKEYMAYVIGDYDVEWAWNNFGDYLSTVEASKPGVNIAMLVGHCAVRAAVSGFERRACTADEIEQMKALVREAMESGALGMASGLGYPPGGFADNEEIIEVAKPVADAGGIYVTHMRNESNRLLESINETIEVGKRNSMPVHVSHHKVGGKANWGKVKDSLALMAETLASGINISADAYPYTGGSGYLSAILPLEVWEEGPYKAWDLMYKPEVYSSIIKRSDPRRWETIQIRGTRSEKNRRYVGKNVLVAAEEAQMNPGEFVLSLLKEEQGAVLMSTFGALAEDDVRTVLKSDLIMPASDGLPHATGLPHPRTFGTFTRVLSTYVFDQKVLDLAQAVRKMSSYPATVFGLKDRGLISRGKKADLVVFDPELIDDGPTDDEPFRTSPGIRWVFVNGNVVIADGEHTGVRSGELIRHG